VEKTPLQWKNFVETFEVVLHGGGEHARVVLDCLLDQGIKVKGIFDPKFNGTLFGIPQLGPYAPDKFREASAVIAIGDNSTRKKAAEQTQHGFTTVIHKSSLVSSRAKIGAGSMILHRTVVQAQSDVGEHVIVNTGAQIDHDCKIGDFVHIGPGAVLCGTVQVGEGALIGAAAVVLPGVKVGKWAVIGAGSVVTSDVEPGAVVYGNPAKPK